MEALKIFGPFLVVWLSIIPWLILIARLIKNLQQEHQALYEKLGCPIMPYHGKQIGGQFYLSFGQIKAGIKLLGLIFNPAKYAVQDQALLRRCKTLRIIFVTDITLFVALILYFMLIFASH